ncbi:hypothetical protein NDU88_001301 [Pleurodeles waltl]|uniref:Uncharacterized protein n=1 Tax=Pleurodeles waltl TaxID=8319 RepID=A0AAV7MU99_PLEWA|nr:hypothetical protein NDU88_001301 [Pleurodeles waltl]
METSATFELVGSLSLHPFLTWRAQRFSAACRNPRPSDKGEVTGLAGRGKAELGLACLEKDLCCTAGVGASHEPPFAFGNYPKKSLLPTASCPGQPPEPCRLPDLHLERPGQGQVARDL